MKLCGSTVALICACAWGRGSDTTWLLEASMSGRRSLRGGKAAKRAGLKKKKRVSKKRNQARPSQTKQRPSDSGDLLEKVCWGPTCKLSLHCII